MRNLPCGILLALAGLIGGLAVTGCGSSSSSAAATVAAPVITVQPAAVTVTEGASATLSVTATGSGTLSYQWYFGSTAITAGTAATYTISAAALTDAGAYHVVVSNAGGSVTSSSAALTVNAAAPVITSQPVAVSVAAGAPAALSVTATGSGTLTYQWYLDGTALTGAASATYSIAAAASTDAGSYYVTVTNAGGSTRSSTVLLAVNTVTGGPSITTHPASVSVETGASATFSVTASSTSALTYQWYFGSTAVAGATSSSLTLAGVTSASAGSYYVAVSSGGATVISDTVTLTVLPETWDLATGANARDLAAGTTFAYTVTLALDTLTFTSSDPSALVVGTEASSVTPIALNGVQAITITRDAYGLTIASALPAGVHVEFLLTGTYAGGITIFSSEKFRLGLRNAAITSSDGPAINIQSSVRAFLMSYAGTTNALTDGAKATTRYLPGTTTAMDLKGAVFSEGPLILCGTGTLTVTGNRKHALCSDGHVRLVEGTLNFVGNKKDAIHTNNAFIMDGGTVSLVTSIPNLAGKGVKVEGKESTTQPLGFVVINGGTLTTNTYDKAVTAGFVAADDATTSDTADDPDPFLTVNGGTIDITTTATPIEETATVDGLSPEGLEAKSTLTINGGTLTINTTDDAINAGKSLVINGGMIYAKGSKNDAIDSNGTLAITGGTIVADGTTGAEGGLDCDANTFAVSGGTFVGIGGRNSTPTASSSSQCTVSLGSGAAGGLVVIMKGSTVILAYQLPYACTAILVSAPGIVKNTTYTYYKAGTFTSTGTVFNGFFLGASGFTASGTETSFTPSSTYTQVN